MIEPVVSAERLTRTFRDFWGRPRVRAVRGISFQVAPGTILGLLGPNGSGKTTTLKMLLSLIAPTSGTVRVFGRSPQDLAVKARLGYLPEETHLYPYLTPDEIIAFYGRLFDLSRGERRNRTDQLLDMVGLTHARRRPVGEFSKGMARRIGLAQALVNDPDLLVLDEPTSGLDPVGCSQVKALIRSLARRGKTIVISSHLLADLENLCDRLLILCDGTVIEQGGVRDLLEDRHSVRFTFPELAADRATPVLAMLRSEFDLAPEVDHPMRSLETFFLASVDRARRSEPEPSGVGIATGVAPYLATGAGVREDVLQKLVVPSTPAAPAPVLPAPNASAEAEAATKRAANEALRRLVR